MSFLEVMIVLVIVGILTGLTLPNYMRLASSPIEIESNRLANIMRDLQFQSILTGDDIRLKIDPEKLEYQVLSFDSSSNEWVSHQKFNEPIPFVDDVEIDSIIIADNRTEKAVVQINIKAVGYVDIFSIVLKSDKDKVTFSTRGVLGNVSISEVYQ